MSNAHEVESIEFRSTHKSVVIVSFSMFPIVTCLELYMPKCTSAVLKMLLTIFGLRHVVQRQLHK